VCISILFKYGCPRLGCPYTEDESVTSNYCAASGIGDGSGGNGGRRGDDRWTWSDVAAADFGLVPWLRCGRLATVRGPERGQDI